MSRDESSSGSPTEPHENFNDSQRGMSLLHPAHLLTPDRTIQDVNDAWTSVLGFEREEVIGDSITEYLVSEDDFAFTPEMGGEDSPQTIHLVFKDKSGNNHQAHVKTHYRRGEHGERIRGMYQEFHVMEAKTPPVGMQRRTQAPQNALEDGANLPNEIPDIVDKYGYLLCERSSDAVALLDEDREIVYTNPTFADFLGTPMSKAHGHELEDFAVERETTTPLSDVWETVSDTNQWNGKIAYKHQNGSTIYTQQVTIPLYDDGDLEGYAAVITDVTNVSYTNPKYKQRAERLDLALEASNIGIWDWDMENGWIYRDETCASQLGYDTDVLTNDNTQWKALIHPDDMVQRNEALSEHISGQSEYYFTEFRVKAQAGHWEWIQQIGKVIEWDEYGEPMRAVGIQKNIDDQRRNREQIEKNNELFQALDRVLRHNINNSTNIISGFAEVIKGEVDGELDGHADNILDATDNLLNKARNARRVTSLLAEDTKTEPIDIDTTVELVCEHYHDEYPGAEISLTKKCDGKLSNVTAIDRINQAIEELIENSIEHSNQVTPEVDVVATEYERLVDIEIRDNGPGIPKMEQEILLDNAKITPTSHGSGLGLWFVKLVVDKSDGSLDFKENEPQGSIVTIQLPKENVYFE